MSDRRCEGCGKLLGWGRSNRHHHDAACRKRAERRRKRDAIRAAAPSTLPTGQDFNAALDAALERALSEPRLVAYIARTATESLSGWRAAAWLLERRYPERWGPVRRPEAEQADGRVRADDPFSEVDELAERRRRTGPIDRGDRLDEP